MVQAHNHSLVVRRPSQKLKVLFLSRSCAPSGSCAHLWFLTWTPSCSTTNLTFCPPGSSNSSFNVSILGNSLLFPFHHSACSSGLRTLKSLQRLKSFRPRRRLAYAKQFLRQRTSLVHSPHPTSCPPKCAFSHLEQSHYCGMSLSYWPARMVSADDCTPLTCDVSLLPCFCPQLSIFL